jgi:hypothetical protein
LVNCWLFCFRILYFFCCISFFYIEILLISIFLKVSSWIALELLNHVTCGLKIVIVGLALIFRFLQIFIHHIRQFIQLVDELCIAWLLVGKVWVVLIWIRGQVILLFWGIFILFFIWVVTVKDVSLRLIFTGRLNTIRLSKRVILELLVIIIFLKMLTHFISFWIKLTVGIFVTLNFFTNGTVDLKYHSYHRFWFTAWRGIVLLECNFILTVVVWIVDDLLCD